MSEWNASGLIENFKNAITYAGEYFDEESNTYYLEGRYYDPAVRRFISEDTKEGTVTNPLSFNLYIYYYDNPMMYFDPSGNTPALRICEGGTGGYHWTLKNRIKYAAKRWVERYNYVKGTYVKTMSAGGGISKEDAGLAFDFMTSYLAGEIIEGGIKVIKGRAKTIKVGDLDSLPQNAKNMYNKYDSSG